jgi:hypothetical protein
MTDIRSATSSAPSPDDLDDDLMHPNAVQCHRAGRLRVCRCDQGT